MENKLILKPDEKMPNLSRIVYKNGGEVPDELKGLYTGYTMGQKAIATYEALKPVHEKQVYKADKNILSKEEEAKAFEIVKKEVEKANKLREASDGKEEKSKTEGKDRTEHVRKGSDNGSKSLNISRERKS